jgi:tRNA(adenine34) deaminase
LASQWDAAMRTAIEHARLAEQRSDVPVGAVLLNQAGHPVAAAGNEREYAQDPTAHAEILVLRRAAKAAGIWRLDGHTLVVTLEPCTMCAGALVLARVERVVFGAFDPKAGAIASLWDVVRDSRLNHRVEVMSGILADDCGQLLVDFFRSHRDG